MEEEVEELEEFEEVEVIEEVEEMEESPQYIHPSRGIKLPPNTNPPNYISGESRRTGVLAIGCATTTLNASSFKGSGAGTSKT